MKEEILRLKKERDAIILAHNYQIPEVQEIADFLGDSLDLSRKAMEVKERVIVFCGVRFMAETAKILSPEKTVLLPSLNAVCPMADMVTGEDLRKIKERFPEDPIVCYVNTNAETKAACDICCTSANAEKVVNSLSQKEIIFAPDINLGDWVSKHVNKRVILWPGYCYVHRKFTREEVLEAREKHPDAEILVHPECNPEVVELADYVLSTNGMVKRVRESERDEFVIGTECGLIERLKREFPGKKFYSLGEPKICDGMKSITLESVYEALRDMKHKIELPPEIIKDARESIERMVEIG
ncbi:quinolinate synthase [bacterium]|nr:MAG: quinolinate synthase [bacterium]